MYTATKQLTLKQNSIVCSIWSNTKF